MIYQFQFCFFKLLLNISINICSYRKSPVSHSVALLQNLFIFSSEAETGFYSNACEMRVDRGG